MNGTKTPVVLVHGLAGSSRWWRDTERALAERHEVHVVDLPGFGDERRRSFALDDAPSHVAAVLRGVGPAHVVGHSLGGLVCARAAARHPELVERLVLVAPAGALPRRSVVAHAYPLAVTIRAARPRFLSLLAADVMRAGPRTLWRAARELLDADITSDLREIRAPTLLVWGEHDRLVPPSVGEVFRDEIPHARFALVAGAHHVPMIDRPHEFVSLLAEFLD